MSLFSKIVDFRCPNCDSKQPAFALLTTIKGGGLNVQLHETVPCAQCRAHLRLSKTGKLFAVTVSNLAFLGGAVILLASAVWLAVLGARLAGAGLAAFAMFAVFLAGAYLLGALRARVLKEFLKVETV